MLRQHIIIVRFEINNRTPVTYVTKKQKSDIKIFFFFFFFLNIAITIHTLIH